MIHVSYAPRLVPPNGVFFPLVGRERREPIFSRSALNLSMVFLETLRWSTKG